MRIGELARRTGVGVETVRYYHRIGLLPAPERPFGGTRQYPVDAQRRLVFIRRAQGLGFSLEEIDALLHLSRTDCANMQQAASRKLELVRGKIADLQRMESVLVAALARCQARRPRAVCPIIETLAAQSDEPASVTPRA